MVNVSSNRNTQHKCECATARDVANHTLKVLESGEVGTLDYRLHFKNSEGRAISPWHSVPLYAGQGLLNFVCEIPKNTRAKYEVATNEPGNPIKQDSKKGKPRSYAIDILWNYGMLPQTWEDPTHASEDCDGHIGDNDPVDVVEIGQHTATSGGIYEVKPIGAFAMIDEGELDWKVVAIAASDPRAALVNDVTDMEEHFPGTLSAIREWFRTYKTFDGKPLNKFALEEKAMPREYTLNMVAQTHAFWKAMVRTSRVGTEPTLAVGDVPVPTRCFAAAHLSPPAVQEGVEKLKEVLEAVNEHKRHQEEEVEEALEGEGQRAEHKRQESVEGEGPLEKDAKRADLVSVAAA